MIQISAKIKKKVLSIKDKLGMPVDNQIRYAVALFLISGFETDGSCQGHAGRALSFPWIDFVGDEDFEKLNHLLIQSKLPLRLTKYASFFRLQQSLINDDFKEEDVLKRLKLIRNQVSPEMLIRFREEMDQFAEFVYHEEFKWKTKEM